MECPMDKKILVEFPGNNFSEVLIFNEKQNAPVIIKNILESIRCEVTLLEGFSHEDIGTLKEVIGISIAPHDPLI